MSTIDEKHGLRINRPRQSVRPSARELTLAQDKLAARRVRDAMPGKIETTRLILRAPIRGDLPELVTLANNINVANRLARLPHPYTARDGVNFIEIFSQAPEERPYAIALDGKFIGITGLTFHQDGPPEIGYWLGEPFWGKGYASEAGKGLIEAAAATGKIPHLVARALIDNHASRRVLTKLGFIETGEGESSKTGLPVMCFAMELKG